MKRLLLLLTYRLTPALIVLGRAPASGRSSVISSSRCPSLRLSTDAVAVSECAMGPSDWAPASVLAEAFGGQTLFHLSSLRAPGLQANVFFKPVAPPVVASAGGDSCEGVAQLLRVELTAAALGGEAKSSKGNVAVAFIQNVAVAKTSRRRGIARALMSWCEARAAGWRGEEAVDEVWLAVGVGEAHWPSHPCPRPPAH